jgi:tRNA/rRNA methyltransferase
MVAFVLVEPRSGGNIGAAARALANLGFSDLRLVRPHADPLGPEARQLAVDAAPVLEASTRHDSLDDALHHAVAAVGATARSGKHRRPHWRLDALAPELPALEATGALAFVFGREAHGLTDAELDRCTHLVHFPASASYPSFNLAQSVLLVAYTLRLALDGPAPPALEVPAEHAAREAMYAHLERALRAIGYLHEDTAEPMMRRIRRMLGRANLTPGEVQLLRGMARQALWLADKEGAACPADPTPPS